jgi:predicted transcriptional regulator
MKQRSSFSVVTQISKSAHEAGSKGISRTKIMQNVMQNYKRASRYSANLVDKELLS